VLPTAVLDVSYESTDRKQALAFPQTRPDLQERDRRALVGGGDQTKARPGPFDRRSCLRSTMCGPTRWSTHDEEFSSSRHRRARARPAAVGRDFSSASESKGR
jgi:hypothetical protein